MFSRRHKKKIHHHIRDIFWPRMGFRRLGRYYALRILRMEDTAHELSIGLATGAAISFTPLPGTHILGACGLSYLLRGNLIAAAFGTLVGNPWTLPIFWWLAHWVGDGVFESFGLPVAQMPPHFSLDQLWVEISQHPMRLIMPWITGGFILMAITWPLFYVGFHRLIVHLRRNG